MEMNVIITNLATSLVLTLLENKPKELDFVHQTISRQEVRAGWAQTICYSSFSHKIVRETTAAYSHHEHGKQYHT